MLEHWYSALASPRGIKLRVSDPEAAKRKLYKVRADANDLELKALALVPSPTEPDVLWIIHTSRSKE